MEKLNKAVFLDRDGVITVDKDYLFEVDDLEFKSGIFKLLIHLKELGYLLIVITNQSGIGRGYYSLDEFRTFNSVMENYLLKRGIVIDKVFFCPHIPEDKCDCRKPNIGLVKKAISQFKIDASKSWFIGDKDSDMRAAVNGGIKYKIFVVGKQGQNQKKIDFDYVVNDLLDIREIIKE